MSKFERRRLSLVVFDFDRADLTPQNRALVERFVVSGITPRSRVRITGTTDRLGEASYNMQLSQARADQARRTIESVLPSAQIEDVRGLGASQLLFDNSLPEGRFYCRTVTITIETPLD
jgi:outer membrane protein OmpA-like peptidoglycan-associated protein